MSIKLPLKTETLPTRSRYSYKISRFKGIDAESDENAIELGYCNYGYNIKFKNGTLTNAQGVTVPKVTLSDGTIRTLPSSIDGVNIKKVYVYHRFDATEGVQDDRIIVVGDNYKVYVCAVNEGNFFCLTIINFPNENVSMLTYYYLDRDVLFMLSETAGNAYLYKVSCVLKIGAAPAVTSACIHNDRAFAVSSTNSNLIHYSKAMDPRVWNVSPTEGGNFSLVDEGGAIKKLVSFKGYLFIFREHAIHRMSAYGSPEDYSISKVFDTNDYIIPDTVAVADGCIVFLAGERLYTFNGYSVEPFGNKLTPLIDDSRYATATFFKNTYYLATHIKNRGSETVGDEAEGGIVKNNALLSIDFTSGDVSVVRGVDIGGLLPFVSGKSSELLVWFNNSRKGSFGMLDDSGTLYGTPLPKLWAAPKSTFGQTDKYKALRRVYLTTAYPVTLNVSMDGVSESRGFEGAVVPQIQTYKSVGDTVSFELSTQNAKMYISNLMMEIDVARRYYGN